MTAITPAGQSGSLGQLDVTQGQFRQQLDALTDMFRQIAGNARLDFADTGPSDPLSAPFTLYVNPYTGRDTFVGGSFKTYEEGMTDEEIIASKLKRLENQRVTCGFTPQRPFKTINRAVIEAAIITSKDWYTYTDPRAHVDCVSIVLAPGVHTAYTDPGSSAYALPISEWTDNFEPTWQHLIAFNPNLTGGILLPRGCSIPGPDLRKCTIRPSWVPAAEDEAADYSNRRAIFKVTGTGFFFGFTFMDKVGLTSSCHLLDCFHFGSQAELDEFYAKCFTAVGSPANLAESLTVTRKTEYEIVGPIDQSQSPTAAWDTTASASPYIFNCSIRSDYGLGGIFADGGKVGGLKSIVTAQFTGVSLQRDMNSWQVYKSGNWTTPASYTEYIATAPDNVRMKPQRISRHIQAINNAFIQEVSVFAIGQGIHHYTDSGGEITITNSNSSFGGCASLSKGYKTFAFSADKEWAVAYVRCPRTPQEKTGNIRKIYLGSVASATANLITLTTPLATTPESETVPEVLFKDGFTLKQNTVLWIENPQGKDWRTNIAANAWSDGLPNQIKTTIAPVQAETGVPGGDDVIGSRVYIRRLVDTRTDEERRVSLELSNTTSARLPQTNFVLQTDPTRQNGAISSLFDTTNDGILLVSSAGSSKYIDGAIRAASVTVRPGAYPTTYTNGQYYRSGTIISYQNKTYQCVRDTYGAAGTPDPDNWIPAFVHMPTGYRGELSLNKAAPIITFDTDTDLNETTLTCGINWSTVFLNTGSSRDQLRTGTDYQGVYRLLRNLGFTDEDTHTALLPKPEADRNLDPESEIDFPVAPSGGAASGRGTWAVEFRRPSILRLYGHAWEWAGWLNYSKSIPGAQQQLSSLNKFTYYFTHSQGGRVVPQGSNEDGFNVSPRGLENIETGEKLSVDNLDFPDIDAPSIFNNLLVNNLTVSGVLDLSGVTQSIFPDGLFPFLPNVGANDADITLRSLGIGRPPDQNFPFSLRGAAQLTTVNLTNGEIDCRLGNSFKIVADGNITFTFINPPATTTYAMQLEIVYNSGTLVFPSNILYAFGLEPVFAPGSIYQLTIDTTDGGTIWKTVVLEFVETPPAPEPVPEE